MLADHLRYLSGLDPGFELSYPNFYPIDELTAGVHEGVNATDPKLRISVMQGNSRISKRSPSEILVLIV